MGHPKSSQIQECMNKVTDELDRSREVFALTQTCLCLENQYVRVINGQIQRATPNMAGALLVQEAKYSASKKSVTFTAGSATYTGKCP